MTTNSPSPLSEDQLSTATKKHSAMALIECTAEPRHFELYYKPDEDDWYPPPCMYCAYGLMSDAHAPCEHSHHRRYRSSKWSARLASRLYVLGIISGSRHTYNAYCRGCVTLCWRGSRPYRLGLSKGTWWCLLRQRHIPGDPIALGMCSKCLPCPDCGSKTAGHADSCPSS